MSISSKERQNIPKNEFGVPGKRKYPLDNPEHIESAARLINHGDITTSEKKTLANKILRRANEEGVDTSGMDAVKKIAEQVPPMSDGTSRGNVAPHLMAPYLEGKDELFARLHGMKEVEALTIDRARTIVNQIKTKVEADSKPPTGNQNCQLCVWCAEAQCRGMHVLPRPIYSPRDPALEIIGETVVKNPVRQKFTSQRNLIDTVRGAVDSRWYVHVNWKDSEGGHEFLVVNIQDYAYLMDPQAGIFQELGTLDSSHSYFRNANMMNSYMVRLDNRTFNSTLLADVNDMSKVLPWDPKLDIPYMKEHGLLSDEDYQLAMNMGDLPVQEAACTASLLNVKNQLMNLLGNDFEFIGGSLIPKFTIKSRMKPDVAIEVNIVGPNVEVTPVYKGIPDILHKRKGIALMQASHVVADFANELVDKYNPTAVKEWCESYIDYGQALSSMLVFEAEVIQRRSLIARIIEWCRGAVRWLIDKIKAFFGWDSPAKTKTDVDGLNNIAGRVIDQINSDDADEINVRELQYELDDIRSNNEQIIENPKQVLNDIKTKTNEINSILGRENLPEKTVTALKNLLTEYMSLMKDIEDSQNGDKNIIHALENALTANNQSGSNTIQVYPYFYGRTFYNDFHSRGALIPTAIINSEMAYKTLIGKNIRCFDKYYDREMHVNVTYANGFYTALLYIFLADLANKVGYQPETYDPDGRHPNAKQYMEDKVGRPLYVYIGYIIPEDEIKSNGIPAISYQMLWDMYLETMERIFYEKNFSKTYLKSDIVTINANPMPKVVKESFMDEYATPSKYVMRKAKESDLDLVYQSELETVGENKDDPKVQRYIKQDVKDSIGHTKIIVVDGKDVGVYQAYETNYYGLREGKRDWWYLAHIYIKPEYRNLGIGSDIIKKDIKTHDKILLQVMKSNKRAQKLYKSLGFIVDMENDHGGLVMRFDKSKPVQEGAIQDIKNGVNPFSDKMVFHVSHEKHNDGQVWKPRVPDYLDPYNPEETGFEDNTTPRVCFSTSIEGALNGITVNLPRQNPDQFDKMYVYIPEKPWKEYKHKTTKELVNEKLVYDANVTREVWIMEPVRLKLYGVIKVDQVSNVKRKAVVPTAKGQKDDRNYFTYKWHWVVKPKVLEKGTKFDYSPERVISDLCIDMKKFKYGLIKDGRLQTGNVSEADYQKHWVFHSSQEVDEAGGGNCWDMVEYEAGYLEAFGVPYKKYFMNFTKTDGKTIINTHTICVVPLNGKFIYLEQAFKRVVDEWGYERQKTFDSLEEIFKYVAEVSAEYDNQDLNYGVWDYTDAKIDYGTPADDFCKWIMTKCKMVYDGEAKKTMLTKEGYRMDQTEDLMITESKKAENLSETEDMEDITIGDLDLDDEENGDETEESISVEETPLDDVEWDDESEDNEPKDDDAGDDNETPSTSMPSRWDTEKTPPELEEIPGYLKDRMSAADKAAVEQPDENLDADNVDLGQFGKDTSDMQNDYDQKEVTILMKLMASEADAMNEYMDGAKETNVDVLRRLYADIANEERFHMEQLLYAKCELTGEKYEPKDPDVKSEYQELLEMGMDEETAMQTAIDKCHIRGSISISDDGEEIASLKEDVQTLESALMMFDAMYQSTEIILESGNSSPEDVDKAVDVFVESCLMQEAVYDSTAAKSEKHPLSKANRRGPIQLLRSAIGFVIKTLMTLIRKFVEFCNRIRNHSRSIKRFIQQYGMQGIFEQKYFFYFINLNFPESSYVDEHLDTLLALAYDTVEACAQYLHIKLNNDNIPADVTSLPRDPKLDIRGNMERGAELLAGAHLVKSAFVVPQDSDTEQRVSQALFGYSDTTNQAGKSNNTLNEIRIRCDRWSRFMQYVNSVLIGMDAMTQQSDSIYYTDQKRYDKGVKILTTVVKTCKAWISAMQYDINQIMGMNQELLKKTEESDAARIENDQTAKTKNETYNKFYSTPESTPQQRPSRFSV